MDEQIKLAFTFAKELATQLITLATGILALTITFTKEFLSGAPQQRFWVLKSAWASYLLSILFGIWHLMALTGTLAPLRSVAARDSALTIGFNVRLPAALQIIMFATGTVLIIYYATISLGGRRENKTEVGKPPQPENMDTGKKRPGSRMPRKGRGQKPRSDSH